MAVLFRLRQLFQRVQAFFLVERHGEQNGFHGVVVALIGGRLGVAADAVEQAVEVFLILAAQRAAASSISWRNVGTVRPIGDLLCRRKRQAVLFTGESQ